MNYPNFNHFVAERFYFVIRDSRYNNFWGQFSLMNVILGKGAFAPTSGDHKAENDLFGFSSGQAKLVPAVPAVAFNSGKAPLVSSLSSDPVINQQFTSDKLPANIQEYGYGFWIRYTTYYPERQWSGRQKEYHFLARLTVNVNNNDYGMGDRLLAIW